MENPPQSPTEARQPDDGALIRPDGTVINADLIQSSPGEGRVGVYVELPQLSVTPGHKTTLPVTVFNQGSVADHFRISVDGVPPDWTPTPRSSVVQLKPGEMHDLRLIIQPPRLPQSRAGHYPVLLHVTSQAAPDQTVDVKVILWVTAYSEFSSSLTPQRIAAGEPAQVKVQNQGNTQEAFAVTWQDPAEQLEFAPPEDQVLVPPGMASVVEFIVTRRRPRWIGGIHTDAFTAQVSSTSGEVQSHPGEIVSKGLIPPWILLVAIFACGLVFSMMAFAYYDSGAQAAGATQTALAQLTVAANQTAIAGMAMAAADPDGDGLTNAEEFKLKTDPANPDTDGDGLSDGDEIKWGADPFVVDTDGDTVSDGREVHELQTSPINPDTDGDGLNDSVDPEPVGVASATPLPATATVTPMPSQTPLPPTNTPAPTLTPVTPAPTLTLPPSLTPSAGGSGLIVFESRRDGNNEIYVMNADGSAQTRLTDNAADDAHPLWSPDGGRIVFESRRDGNSEIYVMNADGSAQTRLTSNTAEDTQPSWSPFGARIAFVSARDGNSEIYAVNADGSAQARLTNNSAEDTNPVWSPDGVRIAFVSTRDGNSEIYVMNADGSAQTRLTDSPSTDCCFAWSPNGARLAFRSDRDGNSEIYVMNADGSAQTRLTSQPALDEGPLWSPDGTRIAFVSDRDGNREIYVMNANGSAQTRLTNHPATDCCFVWAPDGARLAFAPDRDGNFEIYAMVIDPATGPTLQSRLTSNLADDAPSMWRR